MLVLIEEKIHDLIQLVQHHFPNWQGFSDERFINEEVIYKQKTFQKAKELLDKDSLMLLLDQKKYEEFIDRLIKTAQSGKNLLYLATPKQSDINILYSEDLNQQTFCNAFYNLLYSEENTINRLEKYLNYVEENQLPNKWTFPTYYLFVCFPESEIFVKPQTTQWFLQFSGREENFPSIPSIEIYSQYIGLVQQLLESLQEYKPRDFIDIQSFIWVAYSENKNQKTLSKPFQKMFEDWDQANWAFDLLEKTLQLLHIKEPDDLMITVTGKNIPNGFRIRVSYGAWLVLGLTGENNHIEKIEIALFKDKAHFPNLEEGEFKQKEDEYKVNLFSYSYDVFQENENEILTIFFETIVYIVDRFREREVGFHHHNNNKRLSAGILQRAKREHFLSNWEGKDISSEPPDGTQKYWKIAPGENAWNWEKCKEGGFIAMGWDELGDISKLNHEEFKIRSQEILKQHSDWGPKGFEQVWDFLQIEEGDRIVANRGTKEVLGIGTVTGAYYFVPDETHGHRLPVRWEDTNIRPIQKKNWVKTIIELSKKDFEEIAKSDQELNIFKENTFNLLAQLDKNPTIQFYSEHKEEFTKYVETPLQDLLLQSVDLLRPEIVKTMETEKNLFSRFNKNDYGRGGAWPFYWGAFYLKNGKRNTDPQLSLWLNYERLSLGFFIGVYGEEARLLFRQNCQENAEILVDLLATITNDSSLVIGNERDVDVQPSGKIIAKNKVSWQDWFNDPEEAGYDIAKVLPKDQVLKISFDALLQIVADTFNQLYPLVLLAISEDPIPLIHKHLGTVKLRTSNPTYSISQFAEEFWYAERRASKMGSGD